jgi:peptidoglycan/LPS O-acetylase OafA/YrhL
MRLFLPSIAVLIIAAIVAQLGLYMASVEVWHRGLIATPENIVRPAASNWEMAKVLMRDIVGMTNFFNVGGYIPSLQEHLWTINVEFRSSMLLYLFQIGTARLRSWVRILLGIGSIVYLGSLGRSSNLLFFCGALLTEFDLIYQDYRSTLNGPRLNSRTSHHNDPETLNEDLSLRTYPPLWHRPNRRSFRSTLQYLTSPTAAPFRLFHFTCFLLALYLMCTPLVDAHAPGYATLTNYLLPFWYHAEYESHFLWTLGSMLLLSSASHSLDIRPLYTNAFAQYLGRVSYALYFIHGPVLHIAAYGMLPIWEELTAPLGGRETQIGFVAQWLLGAAVSWPIVVYLADLLWRALDVPSVRFARWCEDVLEDRRWKQGRR